MLRTTIANDRQLWLILLTYLFTICMTLTATAADVSELLEKAIYTEETVGDLDKAIEVYEKVVAESKSSIDAAAQAKYRIGACYAKLGNTEAANAAFQAVIDDFPKASDWVAKAKQRLPGDVELLPVPWGDGDELQFEMKLPNGKGIGHQVFRVGKIEKDGKPYWECSAWQTVVINGMAGQSRVLADFNTFAPIKSHWKHTMLGNSKAKYFKDKVIIDMANKDEPLEIEYTAPSYDNEQGAEMFRRLPLKVGFKSSVNIIPILTGTKIDLRMEVTKLEQIEVPAGTFECFKLHLKDLNQTFWISNDEHRYLVRFEAGGVTADLNKIRPFKANQTLAVENDRFSITLPADWYAYSPSDLTNDDALRAILIDPTASMNSRIKATTRESQEHSTAREWLEWGLSDNDEDMENYKLSDAGIEAITINGQEAFQAIYEHDEAKKRVKTRRINMYGESSAIDLRFKMAADEFDDQQATIDELLSGLQAK